MFDGICNRFFIIYIFTFTKFEANKLDRNCNELIFQIDYITRDSRNFVLMILTMQTD